MNKLHVKKDDSVVILSGKDVAKRARFLRPAPKEQGHRRGQNIVTNSQAPRAGEPGGIIKAEGRSTPPRSMLFSPFLPKSHQSRPKVWRCTITRPAKVRRDLLREE